MKRALVAALVAALIVAAGMAYIRLAPSDPARWHTEPAGPRSGGAGGRVVPEAGGARAVLAIAAEGPAAVLARLDAIALSTPRTKRLDGSPQAGRITWITRSAVFGFPDYTTAAARPEGPDTVVTLHARQRFGRFDFGVNAARLRGWVAALTAR